MFLQMLQGFPHFLNEWSQVYFIASIRGTTVQCSSIGKIPSPCTMSILGIQTSCFNPTFFLSDSFVLFSRTRYFCRVFFLIHKYSILHMLCSLCGGYVTSITDQLHFQRIVGTHTILQPEVSIPHCSALVHNTGRATVRVTNILTNRQRKILSQT